MKTRRQILTWVPPVVMAVTIPAHALTSELVVNVVSVVSDPPIKPPVVDEPPIGEPPVINDDDDSSDDSSDDDDGVYCEDSKKVLTCHHPAKPGTDPFEICIAESAYPAHERLHGDYKGMCK